MTHPAQQPEEHRLFVSANGIRQAIGPADPEIRRYHESLIRADYDRSHQGDSFDDLKRRAQFIKEDQGLLRDWMALAARRAARGAAGAASGPP